MVALGASIRPINFASMARSWAGLAERISAWMARQASGGHFGGGYGTDDPVFHAGEPVDEEVGRRAGADADDAAFDHVVQRPQRRLLFEFVLGHGGEPAAKDSFLTGTACMVRLGDGFRGAGASRYSSRALKADRAAATTRSGFRARLLADS